MGADGHFASIFKNLKKFENIINTFMQKVHNEFINDFTFNKNYNCLKK